MKATRLHAFGDVDQFQCEDVPDLVAGAGQVLVKVEASSFNTVELYARQGYLAQMFQMDLPAILGIDIAGTVVAVGAGVSGFTAGARVIGKLPVDGKGAQAELALATPAQLANLPDSVSFSAGATLPLAGLTGRQGVDALAVQPGERVLVTGALGAVGRVAVQYIKELGGIPVGAVRAERIAEAKALTGEALIIGAGGERSFDKAIDTAGGPVAAAAIALLRYGGTLAAVAGIPEGSNADGRITIANIMGTENAAQLQQIADAAGRGDLVIPVAKTLSLSDVPEAHRLVAAGQVGGKIVFVH